MSGNFLMTSEHFWIFSENFKNHKNIWKTLLNRFPSFSKISKHPKISEDFPEILKNHKNFWKYFWTLSKVFQKIV